MASAYQGLAEAEHAVPVQIVAEAGKKGAAVQDNMSLVEVGPRVCLQPIKIFAGSFGGPVLYENPAYVSPNKVCHTLLPAHMQALSFLKQAL